MLNEIIMGRLKAARKAKGITQKDCPEIIGYSNTAICRYERGVISPTLDTVETIAKGVGIPLSELFKDL